MKDPDAPPGATLVEAFAWAVTCGVASAVSGFFGHLIGGRLYLQRYEQIPSDFFFVPLGLMVGFVAAATARLVRPRWSAARMFTTIALVALAYAGLMFEHAKANAVPERLTIAFESDPAAAVPCDPAACPQTDPPLRWTVQGHVRVQEASGLGGTVDEIQLGSYEELPHTPHPISRGGTAETDKFAGPSVSLSGSGIIGEHHVGPNETVSYPVRYSYRTFHGDSRRHVSIYVHFTDAAGRPVVGVGQWDVR